MTPPTTPPRHAGLYHCTHTVYEMTCFEFDLLLERACGKCEFCGIAPEDTPRGLFCIDHDPKYGWGAVRGLICDKCNSHMRYVDAGDRPMGTAEWRYYGRAWFITLNEMRTHRSPLHDHRPDRMLWAEFGRAVRGPSARRHGVLRAFILWYLRKGRLPDRPPKPERQLDVAA